MARRGDEAADASRSTSSVTESVEESAAPGLDADGMLSLIFNFERSTIDTKIGTFETSAASFFEGIKMSLTLY